MWPDQIFKQRDSGYSWIQVVSVGNQFLHRSAKVYQGAVPADRARANSLNLVGVGFDGTSCFRKGASAGPAAIRRVSTDIESYSPYLDRDLAEISPFYDLGDLILDSSGEPERQWHSLCVGFAGVTGAGDGAARFLALGGEHSISYHFIKRCLSFHPDLLLLHLDAHADLRDGYGGFAYSHAAVIRRCLDHFGPGHQLVQFGIRSGTREEYNWMRGEQTLAGTLADFLSFLEQVPIARPLYLTLDLDYFDPAYLAGTGTPEAGGEDFQSFIEIIKILRDRNMVGADVVELAPDLDPTGNSEVFAAKIVREMILACHREDGHVR